MIVARLADIEGRLLPAKRVRPLVAADSRRTPPEHPSKVVAPPMTSLVASSEADFRRKPRRNKTIVRFEMRESARHCIALMYSKPTSLKIEQRRMKILPAFLRQALWYQLFAGLDRNT